MGYGFAGKGADIGERVSACLEGGRGEELDVDLAGVFDGVFGHQGADAFGYRDKKFIGFFGSGVVEVGGVDWVGGTEDGRGGVVRATGQTLPEFFGEERHEGVDKLEAGFESSVEGVGRRELLLGATFCEDGFRVFNVDVAEIGIPVLVGDGGCGGEFAVCESNVDVAGGDGQFVKNPTLR